MGKQLKIEDLKDGMRVKFRDEGVTCYGEVTVTSTGVLRVREYFNASPRGKLLNFGWDIKTDEDIERYRIEPLEGLEGLRYGDILERDGDQYKVLGVCGDIIFLSELNDFEKFGGGYEHYRWYEEVGYKLVDDVQPAEEEKVEITMEEIAEKFGVGVDKISIIKDE